MLAFNFRILVATTRDARPAQFSCSSFTSADLINGLTISSTVASSDDRPGGVAIIEDMARKNATKRMKTKKTFLESNKKNIRL